MKTFRLLTRLLADPNEFFKDVKSGGWKPAFVFFLCVTAFISVVTPIVDFVGIESTDLSSSYQAQIVAYRIVKDSLLEIYEVYTYSGHFGFNEFAFKLK